MTSQKKSSFFIFKLIKIVFLVLLICAAAFAGLLGYLSLTEYYPREEENIAISGEAGNSYAPGSSVKVMTWNLGYGALGDNADFFMDGGTHVNTADKNRVLQNMSEIEAEILAEDADFICLQETDRNSSRSGHIDETARIQSAAGTGYQASFANNFKVAFIPYPVPPIGKVDSGLLTLSRAGVSLATRVPLPCPFTWPVRIANLKRCLLVNRIPLDDTDKELVLVNLHLEAYDSGEGKIAQTKKLMDYLQQEADKGNYVIATGDFNQSFSNVDISQYPSREDLWTPGLIETDEYMDTWQFLMDNSAPTCRSLDQPYEGADHASFQYYMLDGFILSSNLEVKSVVTKDLDFVSSDHNPVILECILRK